MKLSRPYIEHILQECEFLLENSEKLTFEEFIEDNVLMRAFVRSLEVIGEATKYLPEEFRKKYSHIPWREIAGMRDKLIHEYFGVSYTIIWETVEKDIPKLKNQIEEIMKKEGWLK